MDSFIRLGLPLAAGAGIVAWIFLSDSTASPSPPAAQAHGCYMADGEPRVMIDESGFRPIAPGAEAIPFHLESTNSGLRLALDWAPLTLLRSEKAQTIFGGKPLSFPVHTVLDTPRLVDGFWRIEADGSEKLFRIVATAHCS